MKARDKLKKGTFQTFIMHVPSNKATMFNPYEFGRHGQKEIIFGLDEINDCYFIMVAGHQFRCFICCWLTKWLKRRTIYSLRSESKLFRS
ncbi:hypothetical protein O6P43_021896 [Quillaja saponaria]|uniref:Uncharacterized protein n=1 Tax=Quillaja saponaria TaxID=32244 RepID=A0AAD7LCN3_QUISA|nr:hypothetical protein O6P43_021896 [Quillaja saponaria]